MIFFSAADPHAGNILFCLSTKDQRPSHILDSAAAAAAASSHSHTNTNTNSGASGGLRYSSDRASVASQLSQLSEEGSIAQGGGVCSSTADRFMASDQSGQVSSSADRSSTAPTSTASRNSASSGTPLETAAPGENAGAADEANEERHCTSNVYDRHIYDATPAKGVTFGSQTANSVPSPAAPAVLHSVASAPTQGADCVLPLQRRMIYDATPGKNVGFAAEISPHSAVSYSTQATSTTPGAHPTQQVSQQTPIRAAPAPIAAAAAGHTPYPMSGLTSASSNGARRRLASTSPGSSIGLSTAFRQFGPSPMSASFASLPSESGACPDIIPGLLDFGMTVR